MSVYQDRVVFAREIWEWLASEAFRIAAAADAPLSPSPIEDVEYRRLLTCLAIIEGGLELLG
jgi:hypothetical protein